MLDLEIVQRTAKRDRGVVAREGYEARRADGGTVWTIEVDLGDVSASFFREEVVWSDAGVVAIGGKAVVVLVDAASGVERGRIDVPSLFGHLAVLRVGAQEWLFVLGWCDIHAFAPNLEEKWISRDVAVDGITNASVTGSVLRVSAEMDPPGGWFEVQLDVHTGREIERAPAFLDDYIGLYGAGKNHA